MPTITGTLNRLSSKSVNTRNGPANTWSMQVDGEWYNAGFKQPNHLNGEEVSSGDKVKFNYQDDQYGKKVDMSTFRAQKGRGPEPAKKTARSFSSNKGGGSRDDYWAKKEEFDKTVTQPLIMRQSANNIASQLVSCALDKGVLPLPTKKQDKWEAYILCYNQVRDEVFRGLMDDYHTLQNGGSIFDKLPEEEPERTMEDLKDLETPEDFEEPLDPADDWD